MTKRWSPVTHLARPNTVAAGDLSERSRSATEPVPHLASSSFAFSFLSLLSASPFSFPLLVPQEFCGRLFTPLCSVLCFHFCVCGHGESFAVRSCRVCVCLSGLTSRLDPWPEGMVGRCAGLWKLKTSRKAHLWMRKLGEVGVRVVLQSAVEGHGRPPDNETLPCRGPA